MRRICPKCNTRITEYESYFCSSCGYKLDEHLIRKTRAFTVKKIAFEQVKHSTNKVVELNQVNITQLVPKAQKVVDKSLKTEPRIKRAGVFFLLTLIFLFSSYWAINMMVKRYKSSAGAPQANIQQEIVYQNTIEDLALDLESGVFGDKDITLYVPYDVDFYFEGFDVYSFLGNYFRNTNEIAKVITENAGYNFAIFGKKFENMWTTALVVFLNEDKLFQNMDFPQNVNIVNTEEDYENLNVDVLLDETVDIEEIQEFSNTQYYAFQIKDAVIITDHAKYYEDIQDSSKKITRNVSHQQKYASARALLPKKGQLFFVSFNNNFEEILGLYNVFEPVEEYKPVLDKIYNYKYDKFVIRDAK